MYIGNVYTASMYIPRTNVLNLIQNTKTYIIYIATTAAVAVHQWLRQNFFQISVGSSKILNYFSNYSNQIIKFNQFI